MLQCCDDCGHLVEESATFEENQLLLCEDCFFDISVTGSWFEYESCAGCGCPPSLNQTIQCPVCGLSDPFGSGNLVVGRLDSTFSKDNSESDATHEDNSAASLHSRQSQEKVYGEPRRQAPEDIETHSSISSSRKSITEGSDQPGTGQRPNRTTAKTSGDPLQNLETSNSPQANEAHTRSIKNRQVDRSKSADPDERADLEKLEKRGRVEKSGCLTGTAIMLLRIVVGLTLLAGLYKWGAMETIRSILIEAPLALLERQF